MNLVLIVIRVALVHLGGHVEILERSVDFADG